MSCFVTSRQHPSTYYPSTGRGHESKHTVLNNCPYHHYCVQSIDRAITHLNNRSFIVPVHIETERSIINRYSPSLSYRGRCLCETIRVLIHIFNIHYYIRLLLHLRLSVRHTNPVVQYILYPVDTIMNESDLHYPPEACPFCTIATAYPPSSSSSPSSPSQSSSKSSRSTLSSSSEAKALGEAGAEDLESCVPKGDVDEEKTRTDPASFVVLSSREVVAFLDILPMVGGEFLLLLFFSLLLFFGFFSPIFLSFSLCVCFLSLFVGRSI